MERKPLFLTLDQGGSASRALAFDAQGHERAAARIEVGDQRPQPGWVEQDPDAVADSLRRVAAAALAQLDAGERAQVRACGLSTQRSSLVAWDRRTGAALSPVLSWQDTRAAAWLQAQGLDTEAMRASTGLYPNAHYGLSKMRWCLDNLDAVQAAAADGRLLLGPLAAFLAFRLLESRPVLVDPANASRTLLFDLSRGDWSDALLARFGIERAWLPVVARSDADYGELVLDDCRLPLRLLSGDQSTAAFAHGELRAEAAYLNVGTGAFVFRAAAEAPPDSRLLRSVVHWADAPQYVVEGTVNGAGSALAAFAQAHDIADIGAALENGVRGIFPAENASDPIFLNGVGGLGSPDWRSDFPSRFVGEGTPEQRLLAVAESIVFLVERNLALLRPLGTPCTHVLATGGISRSDRFCQTLADLTGLPVHRPAHCEATARGAAFLLAGRPTDWAALPQHEFLPRQNPALSARHRRWQEAMAQELGRVRYADEDIDVQVGDIVTYKSLYFWRDWKPGRVWYVPGQSTARPWMERNGSRWVGVVGDGGTYRGILVDPMTCRVQGAIKFQRRADGD
jgi:glycerol kinase